jgi:hypothetical protein
VCLQLQDRNFFLGIKAIRVQKSGGQQNKVGRGESSVRRSRFARSFLETLGFGVSFAYRIARFLDVP